MRILVFSDTHGRTAAMIAEAKLRNPDLLIHLGDYVRDARALSSAMPHIPMVCVPGNCDLTRDKPHLVYPCGGLTLYITHGHLHHVKQSLALLQSAARAAHARAALFGHTHSPCNEDSGGLLLFNPGSPTFPHDGRSTCGLLEIEGGQLSALVVPLSYR
ncbi:MAG: YfcE family phosphodiesterase [Oscillospiraceae bacterium]|nr:YfcE family phosphodiesterase [Oscillospiraceae bacterium]